MNNLLGEQRRYQNQATPVIRHCITEAMVVAVLFAFGSDQNRCDTVGIDGHQWPTGGDGPLLEASASPLCCIVRFVVPGCQIGRPDARARRSAYAAIAAMSPPNRSDILRRMR